MTVIARNDAPAFRGPSKPTAAQRDLYKRSYAEIQHNLGLLKAGASFREISDKAYRKPENCQSYSAVMHGVGLCDEAPRIVFPDNWDDKGYDGAIQADTVMCVESYVGFVGEREGVKLEEQVLVKQDGIEILTSYPFEDSLLV